LCLKLKTLKSFFKSFFASFLAIVVFFTVLILLGLGIAGALMSDEKPVVGEKGVLLIDLSKNYNELKQDDPFAQLSMKEDEVAPDLSTLIKIIGSAKTDSSIKGIYLMASENPNGYATSNEIRNALIDFKKSKKFILSYADYISEKAYYIANISDKIYCNPKGMFQWQGMSVEYVYFKNMLDKLEIKTQIFYAGKFKSATEPFRESKMTEANRAQTTVWLNDLYDGLITGTASARGLNADSLKLMANNYLIVKPEDALKYKLIDGLKYDDEVKDEMRKRLGIDKEKTINLIRLHKYEKSIDNMSGFSKDKIALVIAEGEIVYGKGKSGQIGSDDYLSLLRKLRFDKNTKAIVLRINSPGGSSLASEIIWRELELIRKAGKPVVVSMGDVAASGGYYIACNANRIFADPKTITGSIGVFAIIPNVSGFMENKIGITFDRVKTSAYADAPSLTRPMTEFESRLVQSQVDQIYLDFKTRVADGRKKSVLYIDSIAQGRVWAGSRALELGLVDQLGYMNDAISYAVKSSAVKDYRLKVYPEPKSFLEQIFDQYPTDFTEASIKKNIGKENYQLFKQIESLKNEKGEIKTRLPFDLNLN
jgi:protease-4